jgi:hypothetical protein
LHATLNQQTIPAVLENNPQQTAHRTARGSIRDSGSPGPSSWRCQPWNKDR